LSQPSTTAGLRWESSPLLLVPASRRGWRRQRPLGAPLLRERRCREHDQRVASGGLEVEQAPGERPEVSGLHREPGGRDDPRARPVDLDIARFVGSPTATGRLSCSSIDAARLARQRQKKSAVTDRDPRTAHPARQAAAEAQAQPKMVTSRPVPRPWAASTNCSGLGACAVVLGARGSGKTTLGTRETVGRPEARR